MRDKAVIALAVAGLFAGSGIAMADSHQEEKYDTVFNYGYDAGNQFLIWNVSSLDYQPNDEALLGALYPDFESLREACSLTPDVVGGYSVDAEGGITLNLIADLPPGCESLTGGGFVTGPNGQVNHGMFMKLFNSLYDGPRKGCLVRHLAHTDLGKTEDTKVQAIPGYEAPEDPVTITDGVIAFTTEAADCIKGKKGDGGAGTGGPPAHVLEKKAEKAAEKLSEGKPGKGPNKGN